MSKRRDELQQIKIAAPCSIAWSEMTGDERKRFCGACKLHVYNLSAMSEDQVADLFNSQKGRLCIGFYRRKDGTIMFDNCPQGLRAIRDAGRRFVRLIAGVASFLLTFAPVKADSSSTIDRAVSLWGANVLGSESSADFVYGEGAGYGSRLIPSSSEFTSARQDETALQNFLGGEGLPRRLLSPSYSEFTSAKQDESSLQEMSRAIEKNPGDCNSYVQRAWIYLRVGNIANALADCNMAISIKADSAGALDTRGHIELKLGKVDDAIADFTRALTIDPTLGSSHYFRAQAYKTAGKDDLAAQDLQKAADLGFSAP